MNCGDSQFRTLNPWSAVLKLAVSRVRAKLRRDGYRVVERGGSEMG
jgi:hypothetical protein